MKTEIVYVTLRKKSGGKKSSRNLTTYGVDLAQVETVCAEALDKKLPGCRSKPPKVR